MGSFDSILRVNLRGPVLMEAAMLPLATTGAVAIFVSSLAAHGVQPDDEIVARLERPLDPDLSTDLEAMLGSGRATSGLAYQLSKFGLNMLCRQRAAAWGERDARIVSLSPGLIASPMSAFEFERVPEKHQLLGQTPLRREGTMLEVADALEFLASDRACFITGTDLLVDGGIAALRSRPG